MISRVLVIKLGALGDFVMATGPFASIRAFHRDAEIVLLTRKPYESLARAGGWFDRVWIDGKPRWWRFGTVLALKRLLNSGNFDRVYDLQISDRTSAYYRLFHRPRPEWSGVVRGCSHFNVRRDLVALHPVERHADQLRAAGLDGILPPDISMIDAPLPDGIPEGHWALIVPGCAPHRPEKRWPAEHFAELCRMTIERGIVPLLIGSRAESAVLEGIAGAHAGIVNLMGRTSLEQIVALARHSRFAVGNDTGPMHIAAAAGCPSVVLFSNASDPRLSRPHGRSVTVLHRNDLADLRVEEVAEAVRCLHVWHPSRTEI